MKISTTSLVQEKANLGCLAFPEANSAKRLEAWRDQVATIEAQEATLQAPHCRPMRESPETRLPPSNLMGGVLLHKLAILMLQALTCGNHWLAIGPSPPSLRRRTISKGDGKSVRRKGGAPTRGPFASRRAMCSMMSYGWAVSVTASRRHAAGPKTRASATHASGRRRESVWCGIESASISLSRY